MEYNEDQHCQVTLKVAIIDRIESGVCEDFDPMELLESLKSGRKSKSSKEGD